MENARKVILKLTGDKAYLGMGDPLVKSILGQGLSEKAIAENWGEGIGIVVEPLGHKSGGKVGDGPFRVSFRACDKSSVNLSELSEKFGGGGHVKAAGCNVNRLSELVEEYVNN
jgi:hypothetical protein